MRDEAKLGGVSSVKLEVSSRADLVKRSQFPGGRMPRNGRLASFVQTRRHGRSCDFDCRRSFGETRSESRLQAASRPRKRGTPNGEGLRRGPACETKPIGGSVKWGGLCETKSIPGAGESEERAGLLGFVYTNPSAWTGGADCANNDRFVGWTF